MSACGMADGARLRCLPPGRDGREVALAGVAEDREHDGRSEPARDPDRRGAIRARRDADQQTLVAREARAYAMASSSVTAITSS